MNYITLFEFTEDTEKITKILFICFSCLNFCQNRLKNRTQFFRKEIVLFICIENRSKIANLLKTFIIYDLCYFINVKVLHCWNLRFLANLKLLFFVQKTYFWNNIQFFEQWLNSCFIPSTKTRYALVIWHSLSYKLIF